MNELVIENLTKTYSSGVNALNNLSITIRNGMFGLLGPNGAGKSTLMRTIVGLQKPDSGNIKFNGIDTIKSPDLIKCQLGYLPQDFGVYPKISAFDLLEHLAIIKGLTNRMERHGQINNLLEKTNLNHARKLEVHTFSGGMKQRFGIAQALLGNPNIIVVDEPTAGLDPEERNRFNNLLSEVGEQVIIILSTHIVEDVQDLCPSMAIMLGGKLVAQGSPNELTLKLKNKIWSKTIEKGELIQYQKKFDVISSKLNSGRMTIHIFSEVKPVGDFLPSDGSLQDYYFCTMNSQRSK